MKIKTKSFRKLENAKSMTEKYRFIHIETGMTIRTSQMLKTKASVNKALRYLSKNGYVRIGNKKIKIDPYKDIEVVEK